MRINYNVSAMLTNNALANNDNLLAQSLERLSSGLKINHGKDNPAGLAIAKRMNAQLKGLDMANQNASNGTSVIETADGALTEITEMIQRMNELCVQASNGTLQDADREVIQDEVAQLKDEITRISETTEFNSQPLLNGEFSAKGYTDAEGITVNDFSEQTPPLVYTFERLTVAEETDEFGNVRKIVADIELGENFPEGMEDPEVDDSFLTLKGKNGFELKLDLKKAEAGSYDGMKVDVTEIGPMRLQIGSNEGQILSMKIPAISLRNLGIDDIDVSTVNGANDALSRMSGALSFVSSVRGRLGAYENRLESTVNSLDITSENMTAAYSRIMDLDMAEEMTNYTTNQVLTQAGTSMLAQANERPSQVLQLLQ